MITMTIAVLFCIIYHGITAASLRGLKFSVKNLCIGASTCALTVILAMIMIPLPTGAVITCGSLLPIMILAAVYDRKLATLCGYVCGVLVLILIPVWQPLHWAQILLEHLICFSCLGYVGIFGRDKKYKILLSMALGLFIQLFAHTLSGVIFYSQNAWDGFGVWGYSIAYNFTSRIPEQVISALVLLALPLKRIKGQLKR